MRQVRMYIIYNKIKPKRILMDFLLDVETGAAGVTAKPHFAWGVIFQCPYRT